MRKFDGGRAIRDICQDKNIAEAMHHRWREQLGLIEVNEANRLKALERESSESKKMLAKSHWKSRVLEALCEAKR